MNLYSYRMTVDLGSAPNPYGKVCTLTICKPIIRKTANVGDWIIGLGTEGLGHKDKLIYAMKVTDKVPITDYDEYCNKNLKIKIPDTDSGIYYKQVGDCLYHFTSDGNPIQRKGVHSEKDIERDLSGMYSLLSTDFYYFGDNSLDIPEHLHEIIHRTQGHKKIVDIGLIDLFEIWIRQHSKYVNGNPIEKDSFVFCS